MKDIERLQTKFFVKRFKRNNKFDDENNTHLDISEPYEKEIREDAFSEKSFCKTIKVRNKISAKGNSNKKWKIIKESFQPKRPKKDSKSNINPKTVLKDSNLYNQNKEIDAAFGLIKLKNYTM